MRLSMSEYRKRPGCSGSALRYLAASPATYKAYLDGEMEFESTAANLGTAVHYFLDSEEDYAETYVVKTKEMDRRTKAGKEEYARFFESGKTIISYEDDRKVRRIVESFYKSKDPILRMVYESEGENEESWFWEEHGLPMKGRTDRRIRVDTSDSAMLANRFPSLFADHPFEIEIIVDYKTTSKGIDPKSFYWNVRNSSYDLAAAHYLAGTRADAFIWIVLETVPPYGVTRYFLSPQHRFEAEDRRQVLIQKLAECYQSNYWPGIEVSDAETLI